MFAQLAVAVAATSRSRKLTEPFRQLTEPNAEDDRNGTSDNDHSMPRLVDLHPAASGRGGQPRMQLPRRLGGRPIGIRN